MANTNKERDEKKDTQEILLTAEEYAKQARLKTKERINRFTRVSGVFAIILVAFAAILDPLFELTFFGYLWDKISGGSAFAGFWNEVAPGGSLKIFDDWLEIGDWIAKLGLTILYIAVIVVLVYFITYCIVDFVEFFRSFYRTGKEITKGLLENVKDTVDESNAPEKVDTIQKKKRKKKLFDSDEATDSAEEKKPKLKRRKKEDEENDAVTTQNGWSTNQLDDLLSGKNLDDIMNSPTEAIETEDVIGTKKL